MSTSPSKTTEDTLDDTISRMVAKIDKLTEQCDGLINLLQSIKYKQTKEKVNGWIIDVEHPVVVNL